MNDEERAAMQLSSPRSRLLCVVTLLLVCAVPMETVKAQVEPEPAQDEIAAEDDRYSPAPARVDVRPTARDEEIGQRIQRVLIATEWFTDPEVRVQEGVVFLNGLAESEELREWAGDLARNTQDVVAVANRMQVTEASVWDFQPALRGLMELWRDFVRALPLIVFGLIILSLSAGVSMLATRGARSMLRPRIQARLLRNVLARTVGVVTFLMGAYIVLRLSGLTQLALTLVGGTGLIGLIIGIAFRDITENFLASIFLSMQRPFETGDLVEIDGITGYVQQLNVRTTVLMTLNGNLVQIPNSTVYKSNLRNFTTNCNRREEFFIGIGYDDSINDAQEIARQVLADHPAILNDPEPAVLVDSLGQATVNLRIYFWLNGRDHSWLKVRSSVIRLVKRAFQKEGISMPDESREVVFPKGVPVTVIERETGEQSDGRQAGGGSAESPEERADVSTQAEAGLYSESVVIEEQARQVGPLKDSENLLRNGPTD
jgi:small-conductance mechanosensitive channel